MVTWHVYIEMFEDTKKRYSEVVKRIRTILWLKGKAKKDKNKWPNTT
jgi:hypothetical protein